MQKDTSLPVDRFKPPRIRRKAEQTRGLIRDAATELFSERGYLGTSISDIAQRSGVAKSNIFYFYKNKDDLWIDAVEHAFSMVHGLVDTPALQDFKPTWPLFEALLREHILTCARYPAFVKIPMMEGGTHSWRTEYLAEHHVKRSVAWFRAFLQPYITAGMIPEGREFELQALLSGGAQLLFSQAAMFALVLDRDRLDEVFAADYAAFVVSLLRRAASVPEVEGLRKI